MGMVEKYAIVENGVVTNVTLAAETVANGLGWIQSDTAKIGDAYSNGVFSTPEIILTAEESKQAAIESYNSSLSVLEAPYPQKERDTWPQQVTEARAYLADDQAATPLIDAMLTTKPNTTKAQLVGKIMTNYTNYSTLVGAALGEMQEALKSIES